MYRKINKGTERLSSSIIIFVIIIIIIIIIIIMSFCICKLI
jgi:hypothetical protein